jgi:hypothetical protein
MLQGFLDFNGGMNRLDRAWKLRQQRIARRVNHAAAAARH